MIGKAMGRIGLGGVATAALLLTACHPKPTADNALAGNLAAVDAGQLPPLPGAVPLSDAPAAPVATAYTSASVQPFAHVTEDEPYAGQPSAEP